MRLLSAAAALLLAATPPPPAGAQPDGPVPTLFEAERVDHDQERGVVTAAGDVRVIRAGRTLLADRVTYDQRSDTVTASGDVSLHGPAGDVVFAERVVLDTALRDAVMEGIGVRLGENARLAAVDGRRSGGRTTEFRKAVYSPCRSCGGDPGSEPLWQVKAYRARHDQQTRDIVYEHAFLEFLGVPVLYMPWLSQPDPSVERRSGLLFPSYGSDDELGVILKTPVYWSLGPAMDLTMTPVATSQEGVGAELQLRHLLGDAEYDISGSLYHDPEADSDDVEDVRGFVRSRSRLHIDGTWRAGADVYLASDDTYLRKYEFVTEDTLENRLRVEGFSETGYAAATAIYFQGLRPADTSGEIPLVAPMLEYSVVGGPGGPGHAWSVDADFVTLYRTEGTDTRRASVRTLWELPHVSARGDIYRLYGSLQSDAYWTNDAQAAESRQRARLFPQLGADWRLPLSRSSGRLTRTLEPALSLILAPRAPSTDHIPNEDSIEVEFDDTNLFSTNRNTGIDRIEGNPRISYGLHGGVYGRGGGHSSFFVGQSYRLAGDSGFAERTGLRRRLSDIVGRLRVSPGRHLDAGYRFRVDAESWATRRGELRVSAGAPVFRADVNYLLVKNQAARELLDPGDLLQEREEVRARLSSEFAPRWQAGVNVHRDLTDGGRSLRHGAYLLYEDECLEFHIDYSRRFTSSRVLKPQDTVFLRLGLKTLGEVDFSRSAGRDAGRGR